MSNENNSKPFSVCLWGSHPDKGNDDCWTGEDYGTLAEAESVLANPWGTFLKSSNNVDTAFFTLEGPGIDRKVVQNPDYNPRKRSDDDSAERSERAMQAGMAFGCDGYNDEMGW